MEYYSAIKRNEFESVLKRWMSLEPVTQSEVSHKEEKQISYINAYIWNRETHDQWCHPTISSSVVPFSSRLQTFPTSGSFPMNQFFTSGGQSIGVSVSASVLPMNTQDWSPLEWTGWISLQSKGLSRVFSNTTVQKHQFSAFFIAQLSQPYMTTGKSIALTRRTIVSKVMSLLFNMLSRLVITFLQRSKRLLISLSNCITFFKWLFLSKPQFPHW